MDHREVVCDTYIWTEIDLDWFPRDEVNRQVRPQVTSIKKINLRRKKTLFMDHRGHVITYEQKLIWISKGCINPVQS